MVFEKWRRNPARRDVESWSDEFLAGELGKLASQYRPEHNNHRVLMEAGARLQTRAEVWRRHFG